VIRRVAGITAAMHPSLPRWVDAVEKVFLDHRAQILRTVGASMRKLLGGSHHQMVNLPTTSVVELSGLRMGIAACFAIQREICSSVLLAFFDSTGHFETSNRVPPKSVDPSILLQNSSGLDCGASF
jgi:hypothetical protein